MKQRNKKKKSKLNRKKELLLQNYLKYKFVYCPALKTKVYFTRLGWNHLVERKKRTSPEYFRRLETLPYAKKIIANSTTLQGRNVGKNDGIEYVNFISVVNGMTVKVTVTRIVGGKFTFFSVRRIL